MPICIKITNNREKVKRKIQQTIKANVKKHIKVQLSCKIMFQFLHFLQHNAMCFNE